MLRNGVKSTAGSLLRLNWHRTILCVHQICTGNGGHCAKQTSLQRQGKIMSKLFGERVSGSKKRWYPTHDSTSATSKQGAVPFNAVGGFNKPTTNTGGKNVTRRMIVLNKLFMKHITDLLATGEASEAILGRGLQVTRVKISPDFACINVYWLGSGDVAADTQLERNLQQCSGRLRHELSQLMLMSEVPRVHFAREKKFNTAAEVEALLRTLDLRANDDDGDVSKDQNTRDKQWHSYAANLTQQEFYGVIRNPHATDGAAESDGSEQALPEMRHDVLGLDHRAIMSRILTKMRKSKQAWDMHKQHETDSPIERSELTAEHINQKLAESEENDAKLNKFLAKRRERKNTPERKKYDRNADLTALEATLTSNEQQILCDEHEDYLQEDVEPDRTTNKT